VYPREYSRKLSKQIIQDLKCSWFVIKPLRSSAGNGVIITQKSKLAKVLKLILDKYRNNLPYDNTNFFNPYKPLTYTYWKHDRNSHFIVEEYVPSKLITVNKKRYDATMRVVFVMHYDRGNISLSVLDSFWKRPVKSVDEDGTFREKYISKHAPNAKQSEGLQVSKRDHRAVKSILQGFMPKVYHNMLIDFYQKKVYTLYRRI